jgi:PAS domain S-box-containing protein
LKFYNLTKDEIIGKNVFDILDAEFANKVDVQDQDVIYNKKVTKYEDWLKPDKENIVYVVHYKAPYYNFNGDVAGILGVILDITDEKKAQEDIKNAREYAELINRVTPSCTFTIDTNHRITSWNERIAHLTGFTDEEAIGNKCLFCQSRIHDCLLLNKNISKPIYGFETKIITKFGQEKIVSKNFDVLKNSKGEIIGGIESFEDITQRKEIERDLYRELGINTALAGLSKAIISFSTIEQISDMIIINLLKITNSNFAMVAYIENDVLYLVFKDKNQLLVKSIALESTIGILKEVINDNSIKKSEYGCSVLQSIIDESINDVKLEYLIASPAINLDSLVGILLISKNEGPFFEDDIAALEKMSSLFAIAIQKHQSEQNLKDSLRRQEELNELKSRFISMVSHEYRTPLTAIVLSTELLSEYSEKLTNENKNEHFDRIKQSVKIMNNLIDDIIVYNRTNAGQMEFRPKMQDIYPICMSIIKEVEFLSKNNIKINHEIVNGNWVINIDEVLLRQILINLLSNASKYSNPDSVVDFTILYYSDFVEFRVMDYGIGISNEDIDKIFVPFFRAKNVGTVSGTGLGLAIVKNAVDIHGGEISISSELNKGTHIKIKIPYYQGLKIKKD